jgi:cytochrome P450
VNSRQTDEDHPDNLEKHHAGTESDQPKLDGEEKPPLHKNKPLSEMDVLANATFLLVVGLQTTSTLLTNCFYALSFHQTIQEKLYQTIKTLAKTDDDGKLIFDYDSLTSCQYMDAVISETLRLHPPVPTTDRQAGEDYYLKSHDLHVPKGTKVVFNFVTIMKDPDYWNEPDIFDPERFMPEQRHKIVTNSYCPFGIGPRHCLGMRFSLTESKIALAKLIMEYKFDQAPQTTYPPVMKRAFGLNNMKRPEVIVTKRVILNDDKI